MAPETGYVVGADIGGTNLRLALAGMNGEVLAKWKVSTAGIRDPEVVVRLIQEGVEDLLQQKHLSRSSLRAFAAGAPGVTDVDEGCRAGYVLSHGLARRSAARACWKPASACRRR